MLCKHCDIEIDDSALICYRCGTATREPVHQPAPLEKTTGRRLAPIALSVLFLGTAGFFGFLAARGDEVGPTVWVMLTAAGVLLAIRLRLKR